MVKLPYVLLVDDDQTTNYLNQLLLRKLDVAERVLVAHDGQQALALLHQQAPLGSAPALVLLDINMPGLNGVQFLEQFCQLPSAQQQGHVLVMLTTSLHPRDVQQVAQLGLVAGFVTKPLTADKLRAIMTDYCQPVG